MPRISTPIALVSTSTLTFDLKTLGGELASTHTCNHRTGVIRAFNHEPACGTSTTGRKRESLRRQSSVARATARTLAPKEEDLRLMRQGQGNAHEPFLRWQGGSNHETSTLLWTFASRAINFSSLLIIALGLTWGCMQCMQCMLFVASRLHRQTITLAGARQRHSHLLALIMHIITPLSMTSANIIA